MRKGSGEIGAAFNVFAFRFFFFFVKQKDRRLLFSFFVSRKITRELFSPTISVSVCPFVISSICNTGHLLLQWCSSVLSCFAFLLRFAHPQVLG